MASLSSSAWVSASPSLRDFTGSVATCSLASSNAPVISSRLRPMLATGSARVAELSIVCLVSGS